MDDHEDRSLEPSRDEMRRLLDLAAERVVEHVASLPRQPAQDVDGAAELARAQIEELPREPTPYEEILDLLFERLVPKSFNTASPGYLAYIPGGGLFHSAVADLIADATNRYVGVWQAAPALAQLEANVVRWFCDIVGYPEEAGGFLTTGGSLANLTGVVMARRERLGEDFLDGVMYASEHTHHSVAKAAVLAGIREDHVRRVPTDERFRVRPDMLHELVDEDRGRGLRPFLLIGNAGTTNTGAVDDLEVLADVAAEEELWLHLDAAYGGFFMLTERGRRVLRGIERADSVTVDPHKGLFLPYGTGSLLVRDRQALERTHALRADYMPDAPPSAEHVDFSQISPELSRDFRGLRVWLPLKMHGIEPFRRNLDEKLDLARWITDELRALAGIEIVAEPQLSLVAFRWRPAGLEAGSGDAGGREAGTRDASARDVATAGGEDADALNRQLLERINARRRVQLTGTRIDGCFVLRICVLSFRTHRDRMEACLEDIVAALDELRAERAA